MTKIRPEMTKAEELKVRGMVSEFGFGSIEEFRTYMRGRAKKPRGQDCMFYEEKRQGVSLIYSDNCKYRFIIGANVKGIFRTVSFN